MLLETLLNVCQSGFSLLLELRNFPEFFPLLVGLRNFSEFSSFSFSRRLLDYPECLPIGIFHSSRGAEEFSGSFQASGNEEFSRLPELFRKCCMKLS
jgi:hypothetical protein